MGRGLLLEAALIVQRVICGQQLPVIATGSCLPWPLAAHTEHHMAAAFIRYNLLYVKSRAPFIVWCCEGVCCCCCCSIISKTWCACLCHATRPAALTRALWGDYTYSAKDKRVVRIKPSEASRIKPMFVQMILEPVWKVRVDEQSCTPPLSFTSNTQVKQSKARKGHVADTMLVDVHGAPSPANVQHSALGCLLLYACYGILCMYTY
jgi:hypothetical protein